MTITEQRALLGRPAQHDDGMERRFASPADEFSIVDPLIEEPDGQTSDAVSGQPGHATGLPARLPFPDSVLNSISRTIKQRTLPCVSTGLLFCAKGAHLRPLLLIYFPTS